MESDRYAKWGAASGLVFLILFVVGFGAFVTPNAPDVSGSGADWQSYFSDHQDRIQAGIVLVSISVLFLFWFLGSLRAGLAAAEGGNGRLTAVAYGAGLGVMVFFVIAVAATAVAAYRPGELDPNVTRMLNDTAAMVGAPGAAAAAAFFGATAILGYRKQALPAPVAGFCALAAITQPLTFFVPLTQTGAFAPDGALGLVVPLITFVVGFLALSVAILRKAPS